jgi:hypothetical protein
MKGSIIKMKNKWKGLIILILVSVIFLVSCAPSSVVRVTEPNGKVVADNQQDSSHKDQEKQQTDKDNKEKPKDSNTKDNKNTEDNKGNIIAKASNNPEENQKKNDVKAASDNTKNASNNSNQSSSKAPDNNKSTSNTVTLAKAQDSGLENNQNNDASAPVSDSGNNQNNDASAPVSDSGNNQSNDAGTPASDSGNIQDNNGNTQDNGSETQPQTTTPPTPTTPATPAKNTAVFASAGTQMVDVNGEQKELPKGVKTVAAAGQYASIVGMIGGGASLVGTSNDNAQAGTLFSAVFKNGTSIPNYMPSAGQAMTQGQLSNILSLDGDKKPQVVLCDSATFSALPDAASKLNTAGIQTVTMEEANANVDRGSANDSPYQTVKYNVQVLGKMMDSSITIDGKHPEGIANDFNSYYDDVKSDLGQYHYSYADGDTTLSSYGKRRLTYYVNSFGIAPNNNGDVMSASDYQAYLSLTKSDLSLSVFQQVSKVLPGSVEYKNNLQENIRTAYENWARLYRSKDVYRYQANLRYGQENNFFTSALQMVNVDNQFTNKFVGMPTTTEIFYVDHLIVNSPTAVGERVELMTTGTGTASNGAYPAGEVTLNVQPQGVNSWTSGAPESVLEPLWLATVFHSKDSGVNIRQKISEFYSKFYHYNLNDNQINQILKTP